MIDLVNNKKCTGCTSCFNICPMNAIKMEKHEGGFLYPNIDENICIECGICKSHCPIHLKEDLFKNKEKEDNRKVYACINKDEKIRYDSSSGGIFTLLSEYILDNNGVIFGVEYNEKFEVIHSFIENKNDIRKYRGSKYTQSDLKESFKKVKEFLDNGRIVYFSGTPCETNGLYTYLGKEYDNLFIQDCICHGAPAPKLLEKYLEYLCEYYSNDKSKRTIKNFSFRNKENLGWSKYQLKIEFDDGEIKYIDHDNSSFMKIFLNDYALRNSCFECKNKDNNRLSDITLGDYWGINNVHKELNDEKGTSVIIINTNKGQKLFDNIKDKIDFVESKIEYIQKYNPSYIMPAKENDIRKDFLLDLENLSYKEIKNKYLENNNDII